MILCLALATFPTSTTKNYISTIICPPTTSGLTKTQTRPPQCWEDTPSPSLQPAPRPPDRNLLEAESPAAPYEV